MTPEHLASLVGDDIALKVMARKGGLRIYVPRAVTPSLTAMLDCDKAAANMAQELGGTFVVVPVAKRWRMVRLKARGWSVQQIALALGMTEQAVFRALAETRRQHEHDAPRNGMKAA